VGDSTPKNKLSNEVLRCADTSQRLQPNTNQRVLECVCKTQRNANGPVRTGGSNLACTDAALPVGETILGAGEPVCVNCNIGHVLTCLIRAAELSAVLLWCRSDTTAR
jgi:hypothetical protein